MLSAGLLVAVVLCLVVLGGLAVLRRRDVVRLDETGYRVRYVRGAGVRQAPWKDVEDVTAPTVEGQRCVVLRLRDGRTTTMPGGRAGRQRATRSCGTCSSTSTAATATAGCPRAPAPEAPAGRFAGPQPGAGSLSWLSGGVA